MPASEYTDMCRRGDLDNQQKVESSDPQIVKNAQQGRAFEQPGIGYLNTVQTNVQPQVAIRPYTNSEGDLADYYFRVDGIGQTATGDALSEFKSSDNARFTTNQRNGYPLMGLYGGQVVGGNGGGIYPAGYVLPPTPVQVYRPGGF